VPGKEQVKFVFGQRAYVLHLKNPQQPRWTWDTYGVSLRTAGLYEKFGVSGSPGAEAQYQTMFGQNGGHRVFRVGSATDNAVAVNLVGTTERIAPAGSEGEVVLTQATISVLHTMAGTLRVTPIVDEVAKPARDITLTAKGTRTLESFEIALYETHAPGGVEQTKVFPRGTWIQFKVETIGGLAAGDLELTPATVEYEVVRESRPTL
jgi:hypothetical protein